jgi:hypothetical protein
MEFTVTDLRVETAPAGKAVKGTSCSVAVPLDGMPEDMVSEYAASGAPPEKVHPHRGDKVYLWQKIQEQ